MKNKIIALFVFVFLAVAVFAAAKIEITEDNYEAEILNSKGVVLLVFTANYCAPCRGMKADLDRIVEEPAYSKVKIATLDVGVNANIAFAKELLGDNSIPQLFIYKDGKEQEDLRYRGYDRAKFKTEIKKDLDNLLK
jgi:thioredoxin 1